MHQLVGDLVVRGAPLALHLLAHLHAEVAQALAALPPAAAAQAAAVARAGAAPARRAPAAGKQDSCLGTKTTTLVNHEVFHGISLILVGMLCKVHCPVRPVPRRPLLRHGACITSTKTDLCFFGPCSPHQAAANACARIAHT